MCFKRFFLSFVLLVIAIGASAQSCPPNIGFENGTLDGWKCYIAQMDRDGLNPTDWGSPIPGGVAGRHTIVKNTSPQSLDPVGSFPVNSPNGSDYSLMLGNAQVSGGTTSTGLYGYAERMTYDFTVPDDDFTMVYYYAVVFQNPGHTSQQQPKFEANLINLDNAGDVDCGAFSFTASAGLQGFKDAGGQTFYKSWSPLVIRIKGHKGAHYQLEFITRDCSRGGHYGYAYLDFNEDCSKSPVAGFNYCDASSNTITLTAPAGFQTYEWKDDAGNVVGNAASLKVSPIPPDGTTYSIHIVPFPGLGCENVFSTTIQKIDEPFALNVMPVIKGCLATGVNLKADSITTGSVGNLTFQYYTDPDGQNFLSDPKLVRESGDYYIRGSNAYGCTDIAKIHVELSEGPRINIPSATTICEGETVNLVKLMNITDPRLKVNYYSDLAMTIPVPDPTAISKSGSYQVKAVDPDASCATVVSVNITISPRYKAADKTAKSCPGLSLFTVVTDAGDVSGITFRFYTDAEATIPLTNPANITQSGTYYYNGTNLNGCVGNIAKIDVNIYPAPNFTVTQPAPVVFPGTVDLVKTHTALSFAEFTYWKDAAFTIPVENKNAIDDNGTFFIKAVSTGGCIETHSVTVVVEPSPEPALVVGNAFTPNGDGVNDEFNPKTKGVFTVNYFKIMNRNGQELFATKDLQTHWAGNFNGKAVPVGTYYWIFSAFDLYRKKEYITSGSITIIR